MSSVSSPATVKVGTSGFSFPDWRGIIYPKGTPQREELIYYAQALGFDCLEINATYYAIISGKSAAAMEKKTGKNFEFVVKGYRGFTHDPFDSRLKEKKPPLEKAFEDIERFKESLSPFISAGKLGCVLLQFPVFFYPSAKSEDYILECAQRFDRIPLVIEFRNSGWAKKETFDFLRKNKLAFCVVDEPSLPRLMPFTNEVTSPDIAYLRLHGRNKNWFNVPASERYDYFYSDDELKEFIPEIEKMSGEAMKTYIFFNNCHAGSAAKNASKMKDLLGMDQGGSLLFYT